MAWQRKRNGSWRRSSVSAYGEKRQQQRHIEASMAKAKAAIMSWRGNGSGSNISGEKKPSMAKQHHGISSGSKSVARGMAAAARKPHQHSRRNSGDNADNGNMYGTRISAAAHGGSRRKQHQRNVSKASKNGGDQEAQEGMYVQPLPISSNINDVIIAT